MEVIPRPPSQSSRPSSTLMAAQMEFSGEASPVPSWVVPSRAGGMPAAGYNNIYTIGEPPQQTVTTTTTTEKTYQMGGHYDQSAMLNAQQLQQQPQYSLGNTIGEGQYTTGHSNVSGAVYQQHPSLQQQQHTTETTTTHYGGGVSGGISGGISGGMSGGFSAGISTAAGGGGMIGGQLTTLQAADYVGGTTTTVVNSELQSTGGYSITTGGAEVRKESRVVGREYGAQRLVSETRRVDESRQSVISERYVEHQIRVPKKIIREEVIEKVYVVPETVRHEEVIDDVQIVREKIVEVAKPTIVEKVVEIPEIEYVERIVEVPERVIQEKIVHKDVVVQQDRVVEVPKIITKEIPRVIPEITYRDVPVEKVVERVEWVDRVVTREVAVPQYRDKPVPQEVIVEKAVDVHVKIPVPVEAEVIHEYHLPQIKPRYAKASYPVYLPRFIEVPVATELLREDLKMKSSGFVGQIAALTTSAASLCEIENLAAQIMRSGDINEQGVVDVQSAVMKAWQTNALQIRTSEEMMQLGVAGGVSGGMTGGLAVGGGAAVALPAPLIQHASTVTTTTTTRQQQQQPGSYIVSGRSPLHVADTTSKTGAVSKKSKKSSKSADKKN